MEEGGVANTLDFHELHAVVSHPRDVECEILIRCLQRWGAKVECVWPPVERLDPEVNLLICLVDSAARMLLEITTAASGPAVVGVLDPERVENVRLLSEVTPHAVILRPVDQAAVMPNIILARNNAKYQQRQQSKIAKLEETLRSYRKVEQAKAILMQQREISEPEAYNFLREQAMRRRVPVGVIASAVLELNEVLSDKKK
jgi:AmiR/NasT family two-component response regulator